MPTASRRTHAPLTERLGHEPFRFEFFQATRILESVVFRAARSPHALGTNTPASRERVRLETSASLAFPASELTHARRGESAPDARWNLGVSFLGLTGATGSLPYHYSELILKRLKAKDTALRRFLDLFHHRTLSLFYRAGVKYRLPVAYEQGKRERDRAGIDSLSYALHALTGLAEPSARERHTTPDEGLLRHAGLLAQRPRSAIGLKRLLEGHFDLPIEIHEFKGQWHELMPAARTRLPDCSHPQGTINRLGDNALLGGRAWFMQGRFEIVIGPLDRERFENLAPGKPTLRAIDELVRFYVGIELDYDFVVRLHRRHLPDQPSLSDGQAPILGWNSWIGGRQEDSGQNEHLTIRVGSCCRAHAT